MEVSSVGETILTKTQWTKHKVWFIKNIIILWVCMIVTYTKQKRMLQWQQCAPFHQAYMIYCTINVCYIWFKCWIIHIIWSLTALLKHLVMVKILLFAQKILTKISINIISNRKLPGTRVCKIKWWFTHPHKQKRSVVLAKTCQQMHAKMMLLTRVSIK